MSAVNDLYNLYSVAKNEENSVDYIFELCEQIKLFGTETNTLTKQLVLDKLESICSSIKTSLNN